MKGSTRTKPIERFENAAYKLHKLLLFPTKAIKNFRRRIKTKCITQAAISNFTPKCYFRH